MSEETTLTIEPGTVVRFDRHGSLHIDGRLQAKGDRSRRILFTSTADHPKAGAWDGIQIWQHRADRPSRLSHVTIGYGGALELVDSNAALDDVTVTDSYGIWIRGGNGRVVMISDCTISRNRGSGINVATDTSPIVANTAIRDNGDYAISLTDRLPSSDYSPLVLSGVTAAGNGGGRKDAIEYAHTAVAKTCDLTPGLDWVIRGPFLDIQKGARLNVSPGARVRFNGQAFLYVMGTLHAVGTPDHPIVFTSDRFDRWHGINLMKGSSESELRQVLISHADIAVSIDGSSPQLEDFTIADSRIGIYLGRGTPTISRGLIRDCQTGVSYGLAYKPIGSGLRWSCGGAITSFAFSSGVPQIDGPSCSSYRP